MPFTLLMALYLAMTTSSLALSLSPSHFEVYVWKDGSTHTVNLTSNTLHFSAFSTLSKGIHFTETLGSGGTLMH